MYDMASKVGTKGQIVIEKQIRDRLGIEEGSLAIQTIIDDRVEIRFFPPEHNESLRGVLRQYAKAALTDEELAEAVDSSWAEASAEKMARLDEAEQDKKRPKSRKRAQSPGGRRAKG
ncbi:MAG: AbrB family transcriptional regulator [Acidobacteria bacterium]|nr:MAG: AbrB family transcriptional regulator [Acidobacteriota bacterium]